ncbi:MAG: MBOAT family protein, partial [Lachnospiraceae bacterium]|nr:MBOAT family protein [Lachnospiraceae bacterium]
FQIYYDFFGYSIMAVGLGKMLGFYLPANFRDPYASKSVTELWQRWHITLGRWFREYLYFPLGGSRCSRIRMVRNLLVVWAVTGFWHGADWNFIFWGLGWFVFIMLEKLFMKKYLDASRVLGRLYMLFLIPVSWIVFAITKPDRLVIYLNRMFPFVKMDYVPNVNPEDYLRYGKTYALLFAVSLLICVPKVRKSLVILIQRSRLGTLAAYVLFLLCLYCLALGMDNPFLYYKF